MVHITKAKGGYMVVNMAKNGRVLSTSEILSSKEKCWKNINSHLTNCYISLASHLWPGLLVQDDTLKKPVVYFLNTKEYKKWDQSEIEKPYKPKQ